MITSLRWVQCAEDGIGAVFLETNRGRGWYQLETTSRSETQTAIGVAIFNWEAVQPGALRGRPTEDLIGGGHAGDLSSEFKREMAEFICDAAKRTRETSETPERGDAVHVVWDDSSSYSGWHGADDLDKEPVQCETLGWLVSYEKCRLIVALSRTDPEKCMMPFADLITIPAACIVSMTKVSVP